MLQEVAQKLWKARRLLFITGAGISAESGLPTYRGIGGLYEENLTDMDLPIEEVLSGSMLQAHPEVTWKFILQIEQQARGARFNRAHKIIADLEATHEVWVLTQNIDGFHHAAGSTHVIDIHGDIHHILCTACSFQQEVENYSVFSEVPPRCPRCQSILRPDVVLFGELLPTNKLTLLEEQWQQGFDLVFTIGTTSVFPYISAPVYQAKSQGIPTVEINPAQSEVSAIVDFRIQKKAVEALSKIYENYQQLAKKLPTT